MNLDLSPSKLKIKSYNYDSIFDTKNRWQSWLDVEAALAKSQSKLGMIPKTVGKKIARGGTVWRPRSNSKNDQMVAKKSS